MVYVNNQQSPMLNDGRRHTVPLYLHCQITSIELQNLDYGGQIHVIYTDFAKAFDSTGTSLSSRYEEEASVVQPHQVRYCPSP